MTAHTNGFTAYSLAELRALKFPEHSWLVEELIPAGSLTLLVGRPKAGKSLLGVDLLASVALGEPFLGRRVPSGCNQKLAIYGPAEDALQLVRQRLDQRISSGSGPDADPSLLVLPFDGSIDQWLRIDMHDSFGALARTVAAHRPALLVLDPLREIHHQPENDADAMAAVLRPLRQLAHESNCAIVTVHHRNKHGTDPAMAARGSSAIVGSVDQTITLDVPDADQSQPMGLLIEGRYGPHQRLMIQLGEGLRWSLIGEGSAPTDSSGRILATLREHPAGLTVAALADAAGLAERTVQRQLADLHNAGDIERTGCGNRWTPFTYRLPPAADPSKPVLHLVQSSVRTCQDCGGNLWHEVTRDTWRCATCDPPSP